MAMQACANVTQCNVGPGAYSISIYISAFDGTTSFGDEQTLLSVPTGLNEERTKQALRQAVAAYVLSVSGQTIDPSDIYFPSA